MTKRLLDSSKELYLVEYWRIIQRFILV